MLPPELMRGVICFAVRDPGEHRAILRLSQVSQSFRQTVLDMSWLFTEANWDRWPTPLLDLWCRRARAQLITVILDAMTINRLTVGEAPELEALLQSYSQHCGTLIFEISYGAGRLHFVERLLQCGFPLLRTISGMEFTCSRGIFHLHPDCLPSLQTLYLGRIWPIFSTSPTSVTELTCTCTGEEDWSPLLDMVKSCHLIQRLMINSSGYCGRDIYGRDLIVVPAATGKAVLSSLTHLEIEGTVAPAISQFLNHCDIPKLESLTLRLTQRFGRDWVFEILCQDVVRR